MRMTETEVQGNHISSRDGSDVLITMWITTHCIYMVPVEKDWSFKTYLLQGSYILEICDFYIVLGNVLSLMWHKIKLVKWIFKSISVLVSFSVKNHLFY